MPTQTLREFFSSLFGITFALAPFAMLGGKWGIYYFNISLTIMLLILCVFIKKISKHDLLILSYFVSIILSYILIYSAPISIIISYIIPILAYMITREWDNERLLKCFEKRVYVFIVSALLVLLIAGTYRPDNAVDKAYYGSLATVIYLEALFSIGIILSSQKRSIGNSIVILILLFIGLETGSRGFILGLLLLFCLLHLSPRDLWKWFLAGMVALLLWSQTEHITTFTSRMQSVGSLFELEKIDKSADDFVRLAHLSYAWTLATENILGIGIEKFGIMFAAYFDWSQHVSIHNFFLREFVALGLLSTPIQLWMLLKLMKMPLNYSIPAFMALMFSGGSGIYLFMIINLKRHINE